ncbi:MAG: hypothetical protein ACYS9X_23240, partial [Planctomycetota bacterium]
MTRLTPTRDLQIDGIRTVRLSRSAVILLLVSVAAQVKAQEEPARAPRIPGSTIAALQAKARRIQVARSSRTEKRRNCKSIIRQGAALVDARPSSPDRFGVLGIILQCQKTLLGLESTDRNRRALFDTCSKLAEAPDEYAELRLEADMLLSDRDLTAGNATPDERAEALEKIVVRYRGTPAEAKSLMVASLIASKLDALDLQKTIINIMDERFADDPAMISFRRDNLPLRALGVKCSGKFTRADGAELYLPADRFGHHCMMVFWSRGKAGYETYLKQVKEHQEKYPGVFEVFSFNLDELPDAGEKALRELGLDWTPMRLPGGKKSEVYRAYAKRDPLALVINAYGYTILAPMYAPSDSSVGVRGLHSSAFKIDDSRISHDRYLAQLQSLFIGDFLVMDPEQPFDPSMPPELKMVSMSGGEEPDDSLGRSTESVPADVLKGIQDCFIAPPFRYRLGREEALANYEKAEKLCADAIGRLPEAPDLWLVRNRRIVALLGLWNLTCEPRHLERATEEARATLAMELPRGADVAPRFCLAKASLRCEKPAPESVLSAFIEATGGDRAPASAVAAAAILALDANSRELHDRFRSRLLEAPGDGNPLLWSVRTFLRNRYHQFYLLRPNYTRGDRVAWPRSHIVNHGGSPDTGRLPQLELRTLDGATLRCPREAEGKLTLLLFVEPPADPSADFPIVLDRRGKPTTNDHIRRVMEYASTLTDSHVNKDVNLVAAFLCDDAQRVEVLMKKNGWTCRAAVVPG